jgi:hypothetical protein
MVCTPNAFQALAEQPNVEDLTVHTVEKHDDRSAPEDWKFDPSQAVRMCLERYNSSHVVCVFSLRHTDIDTISLTAEDGSVKESRR